MTSDDEVRAIARQFIEATNTRDWERFRSLVTDEFVHSRADMPPDQLLQSVDDGSWKQVAPLLAEHFSFGTDDLGQDELIEMVDTWADSFALNDWHIDHLTVESGPTAVYYATYMDTHQEVWLGIEPTGRDITTSEIGLLRFEDGAVDEWRTTNSTADVLRQLGVTPSSDNQIMVENQFYGVVSRVLRHNLRNTVGAIVGNADSVIAGDDQPQARATAIKEQAQGLLGTATKVRTLEQRVLDPGEPREVKLSEVVQSVVETQRTAHPEATITVSLPDADLSMMSNADILEFVLEETVENAAEHARSGDAATIEVALSEAGSDAYDATITVTDDGPGIPDHELAALSRGRETALAHASGIGLWAIKWGANQLEGEVAFTSDDGAGTEVCVHLPEMTADYRF